LRYDVAQVDRPVKRNPETGGPIIAPPSLVYGSGIGCPIKDKTGCYMFEEPDLEREDPKPRAVRVLTDSAIAKISALCRSDEAVGVFSHAGEQQEVTVVGDGNDMAESPDQVDIVPDETTITQRVELPS
jgi:hypothetical protein